MDKKLKDGHFNKKEDYEAPNFESETIFETRALSCGKCRSGPHRQQACMRLNSQS